MHLSQATNKMKGLEQAKEDWFKDIRKETMDPNLPHLSP